MNTFKNTKRPIIVFPEYQKEATLTLLQNKIRKTQITIAKMIERDFQIISAQNIHTRREMLERILKGEFGNLYEIQNPKWTEFGSEVYQVCKKIVAQETQEEKVREIALRILRTLSDLGNEAIL